MSRRFMLVLTALAAFALVGCFDEGGRSNQVPLVEASASPEEGTAPLTVEFTVDTEWIGDGSGALSFKWQFGDGQVSSEQNPSHTYEEEGTYEVSVTVTAAGDDAQTADQLTITVGAPTGDPGAADDEEMVPFDDWAMDVNEACAASAMDSAEVQPEPGATTLTDEQFAQLAAITRDETAAIDAAGLPDERTDEAVGWIEIRGEVVEIFLGIVENPPVDPSNPAFATLEQSAGELVAQSQALGLDECVGE